MKENAQNQIEKLADMVKRGEITAAEAYIEKIRWARVFIVKVTLIKELRAALNQAIRKGVLGHRKADGVKPEVYFNPDFEYMVNGEINEYMKKIETSKNKILI